MLDALRFVATSVAKKDYIPALTHFKIEDGRVTGFNGTIALSSDIDVDLNVFPNALKLIAAINACNGTIALSMTPAGRLAVTSGKFRAYVDCLLEVPDVFVQPEGELIDVGPKFLPGLKAISHFMGVDASRPWSMGVKLEKQSMLATNNAMIAEYWHGSNIPLDVIIPAAAVEELLRIDENPLRVQVTQNSISFWFSETRWLRSALVDPYAWPRDKISQILDKPFGNQQPFNEEFFEAVDKLKPFLNEHSAVYMTGKSISTASTEGIGSTFEMDIAGVGEMQAYRFEHLRILGKTAKTIDWSNYPAPCMFTGENLRGCLVGQKVDAA